MSDERVTEILKNPDAVYQSTGTGQRLIFRQGEDIVVLDGPGQTQGQAITAYGSSGLKGDSGAKALGGNPTDPHPPITHQDLVDGKVPLKDGYMAPAKQIR